MNTRDVNVNISDIKPIGSAGFGMPLIAIGKQEADVSYAECSKIDEVAEQGFVKGSEVYTAAQALFLQDNKPEKIAVQASTKSISELLADIKDKDWRQLIALNVSNEEAIEIAKDIETTSDKMYFISVAIDDAGELSETEFTTAVEGICKPFEGLNRTVLFYYDNKDTATPEAALVGETAGRVPGSFTYKFKTLKGLTPVELPKSKVKILEKANIFTYVEAAGDYITSEGKTIGGEYIDVIDGKDWVLQNIAYRVQKLKNTTPKIGYTNIGITMIENATIGVLSEAFGMGIIAPKEENDAIGAYSTSFKSRGEMAATKRAERKYDGGTFTFELAGAIHETTINGTVSV